MEVMIEEENLDALLTDLGTMAAEASRDRSVQPWSV